MEEIVEFLLARIAEDEANVRSWGQAASVPVLDRALAECEAKRRLISRVQWLGRRGNGDSEVLALLQIMALPYVGHPAYRERWRPAGRP
ncbi:hypothetical protein D477_015808 [Arthrobacter crystallopoietes BAB-32]|uniref:Uncharacterized protein n=1 Tax=Arthrobacter crystallopoietes BAB-32 TaxID=1246476 RepID=N1USA0_9MICC|nr:DUF6221 family protein [Arthrobacter crystallopoietes]EMY33271.1 hypothetical protein D477_015808 [Arthrobacter crystallopoietes BAB-32]